VQNLERKRGSISGDKRTCSFTRNSKEMNPRQHRETEDTHYHAGSKENFGARSTGKRKGRNRQGNFS
jgi:hypothetical protein